MVFELAGKYKKPVILVISLGFGLYFGCLIGAALITSAMNPVVAGFLAALLTAMIIVALMATLWGIFAPKSKDEDTLPAPPIFPHQRRNSSEFQPDIFQETPVEEASLFSKIFPCLGYQRNSVNPKDPSGGYSVFDPEA